MKSNKGITLVSITIYVVAMVIVVLLISVLTGYFYTNVDINNESYDTHQQYTKFNSFFSEEVKFPNIKIVEIGNTSGQHYIVFSNGNQYTYIKENKAIYKNYIKIATNVTKCEFKKGIKNGKNILEVSLNINNTFERKTTYTL